MRTMLHTHGQGAASYLHERGRAAWKAAVEHARPKAKDRARENLGHVESAAKDSFRRFLSTLYGNHLPKDVEIVVH